MVPSRDNSNVTLLRPEFFAAHAVRALSGLSLEGEERNILREIRKGNRKGRQEDTVAKSATELRRSKEVCRASEWSEHDGLLCFRTESMYLMIRSYAIPSIQHHDTRVADTGRWRHWNSSPAITGAANVRYIGQYVKTCDPVSGLRSATLSNWRAPPAPNSGELLGCHQCGFIVELPDSHGYDAVMNVVDSVGKRAHFIPTNTTITALGAARLFLHNVWKLHGLPHRVVSDRGPQFMAEFTRELYRLLGITLSMTTAYHPQATDRQNASTKSWSSISESS